MREALVILGAAVVIPPFHRMRISTVLGFMLMGVLGRDGAARWDRPGCGATPPPFQG